MGGYAGYRMCKKRRALKDDIKRWNREVFGSLDKNREALSNIVEELDKESESRDLRLEEVYVKQHAVRRIWEFNHMEEISWRQKSRVNWLKEDDRNTRSFHQMVSMISTVNYLGRIKRGNKTLVNPQENKDEVVWFFGNFYKGDTHVRTKIEGLPFPSISSKDQSWLEKEREFEEEVSRGLEESRRDKAPVILTSPLSEQVGLH